MNSYYSFENQIVKTKHRECKNCVRTISDFITSIMFEKGINSMWYSEVFIKLISFLLDLFEKPHVFYGLSAHFL